MVRDRLGRLVDCVATGWWICRAVPKATSAGIWIQAALGGVGATLGIMLLMQLAMLAMAPSMPDFGSRRQPRNMAEMQKTQAEMEHSMRQMQENAKVMGYVAKGGTWLSMLASIAAFAAFGWLGTLGRYLGRRQLGPLGLYFSILQGIFALWLTLVMFVIEINSPLVGRLILAITLALMAATYGVLIYLCYDARQAVAKQSRA